MSRAFTDWEGDIVEITEYAYNDNGDRVGIGHYRTVNAGPPEVQGGKAFIIDPYNHTGYAQPLEESSGGYITTYTIGDDVYTQAGEDDWFGQISKHLICDGHGSTRQLTDGNGDVIYDQVFNYDGYGVMVGYAGEIEEPLTNLRYAGEYFDTNLKQYNLRARWYDPLIGRFNQMDPFAGSPQDPQSLHKYLYAHNDPVNGVDPSGKSGEFTLVSILAVTAIITILISANVANAPGPGEQTEKDASGDMILDAGIALALVPTFAVGGFLYGRYISPALAKLLGKLPRGFKSINQFVSSCRKIRVASATDDAIVGIRGSSVTGRSYHTGAPFSPKSDLDMFVVSDDLYSQGIKAGAQGSKGALRVRDTRDYFPKLYQSAQQVKREVGRDVSVRIYSQEGFENIVESQGGYILHE